MITIVIFLFIVGVVILAMYKVGGSVKDSFDANPNIATETKTITDNYQNNYVGLWDGIFGFLLIMLTIAAVGSAFFVDTHPILLPFVIIIIAIYIFAAAAIANTFYAVEVTGAFSSFAEDFVIMHFVMNNLAYYSMILGVAIALALFAKTQ